MGYGNKGVGSLQTYGQENLAGQMTNKHMIPRYVTLQIYNRPKNRNFKCKTAYVGNTFQLFQFQDYKQKLMD